MASSLRDALEATLAERDDTDGLIEVIEAIAEGATRVDALTRRAALLDLLGDTGETNVQGELVQQLDEAGTNTFVEVLSESGTRRGAGLRGA